MDGNKLAGGLRALPAISGVTLVAITGHGRPNDRRALIEAGFDHHVETPVDIGALPGCRAP